MVGIGASAGGLDALRRFFRNMAADSGMAFVVIQHLDPTHESIMADIIGKETAMNVVQIDHNMRLQPNCVYVIRPNKVLTLQNGVLSSPTESRGCRRPIDTFFRSLAKSSQERAIAIILSGTGTNGTVGLKDIKEQGGLVLVQDPDTAQFDGMPRSALASGLVDFILPVEDMPKVLLDYIGQPYLHTHTATKEEPSAAGADLDKILTLLRTHRDYDFRCYKKGTLLRRIQRRMSLHHLTQNVDYLNFLRTHPEELQALAKDLLIGVTRFFRDHEAWAFLETQVVQPLVSRQDSQGPLRIWVPGCATGEEVYSLAIVFTEQFQAAQKNPLLQIFASDLDQRALQIARAGVYPDSIETDVSPIRLRQFFRREDEQCSVSKSLRDMAVFALHNVLNDPPFGKLDLISCRNMMIFMEPEAQHALLGLFNSALKPGGYLFLGTSENIGPDNKLFEPISKRWRIYRRIDRQRLDKLVLPMPRSPRLLPVTPPLNLTVDSQDRVSRPIQQFMLAHHTKACAVVNRNYDILYLFGPTQDYLSQPSGEVTLNLLAWLEGGLRSTLRAALHRATESGQSVQISGRLQRGESWQSLRCTVEPLTLFKEVEGLLLVIFEDQPLVVAEALPLEAGNDQGTIQQLEYELKMSQEDLRNVIEQLENINEEFLSSHEEAISVNEELQSTNEELGTSKEELQSVNEELLTVNQQLEQKNLELESAYNDISNLLASTDIATLFLDRQFRIRRFTPATTRLMRLIASDVGRSIEDITAKIESGTLLEDAAAVLDTLTLRETEVQTQDRHWYLRRTLPYRTEDGQIDGVVITFIDISARKAAGRRQHFLLEFYEALRVLETPAAILNTAVQMLCTHYAATCCVYSELDASGQQFVVQHLHGVVEGQPLSFSRDSLGVKLLQEIQYGRLLAIHDLSASPYKNSAAALPGTHIGTLLCIPLLRNGELQALLTLAQREPQRWSADEIALLEQLTDRIWSAVEKARAEQAVHRGEERMRIALQNAPITVFNQSSDLRYTWLYNPPFGLKPEQMLGKKNRDLWSQVEDIETIEAIEQQALATGSVQRQDIVIHHNGSHRYYNLTVEPLIDSNGSQMGLAGTLLDTTEHVFQRARLREQAEQLAAMDQRKDEFLALLGHELRNPLASVRSAVELLKQPNLSEQDRTQSIGIADRQLGHLLRLVDDLLNVARITSGRIQLQKQTIPLADSVADAVDSVRAHIDDSHHHLTLDLPTPPLYLDADPVRLTQIIANLLGNAAKYTNDNGQITLSARRDGNDVVLTVTDNGIGIPAEQLTRVFDLFTRIGSVGSHAPSGLGLGLSLVQRLVELHGGHVEAASAGLGQGSRFTVRLPVLVEGIEPSTPAKTPATSPQSRRVLLVEDNEDVAQALTMLLRILGHQVSVAHSGEEALAAVQTEPPDVVLLDIGLPDMNGYEVAQRLRREPLNGHLRLIALSGFGSEKDVERAKAAGFDHHLMKPADIDDLQAALLT